MQIIVVNFSIVLGQQLHFNAKYITLCVIGTSVFYIIGTMIFRILSQYNHDGLWLRNIFLILLLVSSFLLYQLPTNPINVIVNIYIVCLISGIFVPLSTSATMAQVTFIHGMSAAILTFVASLIMSLWTLIQSSLNWHGLSFMLFGFILTVICMLIINAILSIATSLTARKDI